MDYGLKDNVIGQIRQVFTQYPELETVLLYGSRAKGNFKPGSDIDLTCIGERLTQSILNKIENDIDDLLLPYTFDISILKNISNPDFIDHVNRVGLVFYERKSNVVSVG
jgi:predicted nucleotidyltransferase